MSLDTQADGPRSSLRSDLKRAPPTRYVREVLDERPTSLRPQGRPWLRWEDCVSKDAGVLKIPNWWEACQDRAAWRKTCDAEVGVQAL